MKSARPKQYLTLIDAPVLLHTLSVFEKMKDCERIVIATDDRENIRRVLDQREWSTAIDIVLGGERRQDSVEKALATIEDDARIVLVHDAARPCVLPAQILAVVKAVVSHGAAVLAIPARDTLKQVEGSTVIRTIDRSTVWQAQTPQGARAGVFREAFAAASRDGVDATDDMSLLEYIGKTVRVVPGTATNLKITEAADLLLAETILLARRRGEKI